MANGKPGAPSKLSDATINVISSLLAKGMYLEPACHLANISPKIAYEWLQQADIDESIGATAQESTYIRFRDAVNSNSASNELELVNVIKSAAVKKGEWLPAITFLERRHPHRWGRQDRTRVDINETRRITITHVEYCMPSQEAPAIDSTAKELPESTVNVENLPEST